ncbi:hypothetical protein C0Q70_21593 [Pomacea canaliculata]|uniref:Metallothionein n=1 Tax=Pomacea canaliculata TaxID=400727 RepID=A0A2T7NCY9_POMCA|nr:hypothetical protein C0Q70_21593 [Pomacea canaliculata]
MNNQTGCTCHFNPASQVCACCEAGACQCPLPNMHQCVQCGKESSDCGQRESDDDDDDYPPPPPPPPHHHHHRL